MSMKQIYDPYLSVPGELFVQHVNHRINARISFNGAFLVNSSHIKSRVGKIDEAIRRVDDLVARTHPIEFEWTSQKNSSYKEKTKAMNMENLTKRRLLYKLSLEVEELKNELVKEGKTLERMEKQTKVLDNELEQHKTDINLLEQENNIVLKENEMLKDQINEILKVPTITEYASTVKQVKSLKRDIDLWTQRVHIAEVMCCLKSHRFL